MTKPSPPRDPVSVVIPVHNAADRVARAVSGWADALARLGRGYEVVVVDDGSTDGTAAALAPLVGKVHHLRVLRHDARRGYGAALRTALADVRHPLLLYTAVDYPYPPAGVRALLDRIEVRDEILNQSPDLVSGCRTGRRAPWPVRLAGRAWRLVWRVAFGLHLDPPPSWLGARETAYRWLVKWLFGVPLADVNSAFKLYRTDFLRRVPIQSDGDFVHAELAAKATFLTSVMDEVPLAPSAAPLPPRGPVGRELLAVFRNPEFVVRPAEPVAPDAPPGGATPAPAPAP